MRAVKVVAKLAAAAALAFVFTLARVETVTAYYAGLDASSHDTSAATSDNAQHATNSVFMPQQTPDMNTNHTKKGTKAGTVTKGTGSKSKARGSATGTKSASKATKAGTQTKGTKSASKARGSVTGTQSVSKHEAPGATGATGAPTAVGGFQAVPQNANAMMQNPLNQQAQQAAANQQAVQGVQNLPSTSTDPTAALLGLGAISSALGAFFLRRRH